MSFGGIIERVEPGKNGTAVLHMVSADGREPVLCQKIVVEDAPAYLEAAVGTAIWGDSADVYIGKVKWADRTAYSRIRLVPKGRAG